MVGVAQLVRALDCGSRGRGFESHHPPQEILVLHPSDGLSPSGKAPDFDSGIRWFKSSQPSQLLVDLVKLLQHNNFTGFTSFCRFLKE